MHRSQKIIAGCLACVAVSLLLVGIVSATLLRHSIQVLPILGALAMVWRGRNGALWAAIPLFVFWLLIMVFIWLYLLGIARITTGNFTPTEIVLTVIIGAASAAGLLQAARVPQSAGFAMRAVLFVAFAALQISAMWYSYSAYFFFGGP